MSQHPVSINLVQGKNKRFFDRFLAWAFGVGRGLIIATEIIALSAFLYRFSLDRELIDLRDNIKQEQKILDLFKNQERTFRNLQQRLLFSSQLTTSSKKTVDAFFEIEQFLPKDIITTNLTLTPKGMSIQGKTQSNASLKSFIQSVKNHTRVQTTVLDRIDNRISTSIIAFNLHVVFKE